MSQRLPSPLGLSMSYIFGWTPGLVDTLKPFRAWRLLDQSLLIHEGTPHLALTPDLPQNVQH